MNILSFTDAEKYLKNRQVYFRKEIVNSDFKPIAESGKVYNIGKVEITRVSDEIVAFTAIINGVETTMYEYKSDLEMFAFVKTNFIPVSELVNKWLS